MPCSPAKARHLLNSKKAKVKHRMPFTIQLKIATGETKQAITLGVDSGAKFLGLSATTEKSELFASEVAIRQDVSPLLADRAGYRKTRRHRKTRYRAPRFNNRVHAKKKGWLAPSIEHRIETHISRIDAVFKILPVTKIVIETASFDIQKILDPSIQGEEYQNGPQKDFWNCREFVLWRDGHVCQHCRGRSKDPVLNVHHIQTRKLGGNSPNNLITLCETCHNRLHTGKIELKATRGPSLKKTACMGIMRPTLLKRIRLAHAGIPVENTFGYLTKSKRIALGLPKTHAADAFCIAGNLKAERPGVVFFQKQTRKHNRQIHKAKTLRGGIRKRNQSPYELKGFRLFDKVRCLGQIGFIFGRRATGYFDVRTLSGQKLSSSIHVKKLALIEKRQTFLSEWRKESDRSL